MGAACSPRCFSDAVAWLILSMQAVPIEVALPLQTGPGSATDRARQQHAVAAYPVKIGTAAVQEPCDISVPAGRAWTVAAAVRKKKMLKCMSG